MKYEIRSPIATSVVELIRVADAMAVAEATLLLPGTSGETELHRSTYEGRFNDLIDLLLTEAQRGKLRVCGVDGLDSTMAALVADRLGVTCHELTYDNFQLAATVVHTRPEWLTEWRHDEFVVMQVPPSASCEQGFIGGGILGAPARTGKPPAFVPEQAAPGGDLTSPTDGEPVPVPDEVPPLEDYSALATRKQLIAAFGVFTGMDANWFKSLKDAPALFKARKVGGVGARGSTKEPLFCPYQVMLWLMDPKRKKGNRFHSAGKPWEILEKHFPAAYAKHSRQDPREYRPG